MNETTGRVLLHCQKFEAGGGKLTENLTEVKERPEFSFSTPAGGGKAPITVWHPPENRKMRRRRRPAASAGSFCRFHLKVSAELTLIGAQLILGLAPEEVFCCSPRCSRCWLRMMSNWCVGGPDKPENKETGKQNSGNFPSLNAGFFIPPDSLQECRSWEGKIRVLSLTGDIKEAATAVWVSAQMPVQNLVWGPSAWIWGLNNWNAWQKQSPAVQLDL